MDQQRGQKRGVPVYFVCPDRSQTDTFSLHYPCCMIVFARSQLRTSSTTYQQKTCTATFRSFGPIWFLPFSYRVIPSGLALHEVNTCHGELSIRCNGRGLEVRFRDFSGTFHQMDRKASGALHHAGSNIGSCWIHTP